MGYTVLASFIEAPKRSGHWSAAALRALSLSLVAMQVGLVLAHITSALVGVCMNESIAPAR